MMLFLYKAFKSSHAHNSQLVGAIKMSLASNMSVYSGFAGLSILYCILWNQQKLLVFIFIQLLEEAPAHLSLSQ